MKNKRFLLKTIAPFSMVILIMGCNNSQTNSSDQEAMEVSINKEESQKILHAYLELKDALVQTDGAKAQEAATNLVNAIEGEEHEEIVGKIKTSAKHISETTETDVQRTHFNSLSNNVYSLMKASKANNRKIYKQFCPMAMNNKGAYWLSAEEEVNNPYFGDMMLHCGSVKEVLD